MKFIATCAVAAAMAIATLEEANAGETLPAGQYVPANVVKQLFPGSFKAVVKGYRVVFKAKRDGSLMGNYKGIKDTGFWKLKGGNLCIMLRSWFKGRTKCAAVIQYGPWFAVKDVLFRKL